MQNDNAEALVLGGIILYLVAVVFALTAFMSGQGQVLGVDIYGFDRQFDLTQYGDGVNETVIEDMGGIVDSGEWVFNSSTGLTSNTAGENRLLFSLEPDKDGGYTNEYTIHNPNELSYDIFVKYYVVVGMVRYGNGYHFTDTGIIPFETGLLGETRYALISYNDTNEQFIQPQIRTSFYRTEGLPDPATGLSAPFENQRIEYTILTVNNVEIHRFVTVESWWSYPLSTIYYSGVQTTGEGLSILRYRNTFKPFASTIEEEKWGNSVWGFIATMGYIMGWTLPESYFAGNDLAMWLFAIINVIAIKIPIIVLGYMLVRLVRGGG